MSRADLRVVGAPDEDDADESIEREPTEAELEDRGTVAVARAVDPPSTRLSVAELTGIDLPSRRVIVPRWMRSWPDFRGVVWWVARYSAHVATYHATRAPLYVLRAAVRALVGTWRALLGYLRWLLDAEGRDMALLAHDTKDPSEWRAVRKEWHTTIGRRAIGSAVLGALGAGVVVTAYLLTPPAITALVVIGALLVLVKVGAPEDKPLFDEVVSTGTQPFRLSSKMIVQALGALGIANINAALKNDPKDGIRFPAPIREDGPGWKATVDLPHGVTAAMVMEKRSELASGLRRPLGCVWPESAPEVHAGRLVLWVGHRELSAMKPPPAPYLKEQWRCDAFGLLPFGFDQRGVSIEFELMYGNLLVGALPGAGKTASVRGLLLALSLDPTVEMRISEHKGSGDLSMFERMAHFYVSGVTDEDIALTVQMLRDVLNEIERRAKQVKRLGVTSDLAPESKVTRTTANMRQLGLWPIAVVVDECQELFTHDEYGKEAAKLAERIIKRGRAFGVITIWATQRPDSRSVPTGVSGNVSHRFCLRVTGQVENDMILGTSAYKQGIQATTLSPRDKGVGFLKGAFDDALVVRSHYQDKPTAEKVAVRAHALRKAAGTVTGMAAGDEPERPPSYSLLDDLQTIFVTCERAGMHSETVCERLRELRPDAYADWSPATLAAALPDGLSTTQVSIEGWNRRGLKRQQVLAAIAARDLPQLEEGR